MVGRFTSLLGALVVWSRVYIASIDAKVVHFVEPGFFFDYNPPETSVPIPVTEQCETLHLKWGRQAAIGPNPVAPYSLQVYTSTFTVPVIIDAGPNLSFDWAVPFAPGTQYQICMFDSNGVPGGCQAMYTVIQNSTIAAPTCQNVTFPNSLDIQGTVQNGPISQYGFIDQCTDVTITPKAGKPPFILTIAPPLHPPFNLTSNSMAPITWTISLSRAMPFFMSMVSSDGLQWANGPMHVGGFGPTDCLAPGTIPTSRANGIAAGAGVGGLFGGLFLAATALLGLRYFNRRRKRFDPQPFQENMFSPLTSANVSRGLQSATQSEMGSTTTTSSRRYSHRILPPLPIPAHSAHSSDTLTPQPRSNGGGSQVYVMHHDAGRAPVTVITNEGDNVVELPPTYVGLNRSSRAPSESSSPHTDPEKF